MRYLLLVSVFLSTAIAKSRPPKISEDGQRILFQGDSITDGNRGRSADPNHILGHRYAFIIAAKFGASFPQQKLGFINRVISGNKVGDVLKSPFLRD